MEKCETLPRLVDELIQAVQANDYETNDNRQEIRQLDIAVSAACLKAGITIPSVEMEEPYSPFGQTRIPHWSGRLPGTDGTADGRLVFHHVSTHNWLQAMQSIAAAAGGSIHSGTPLAGEAVSVLKYLNDKHPKLCSIDDIENGIPMSRKTAVKYRRELLKIGMVTCPQGDKKGATITDGGRAELANRNCAR